MANAPIVKRLTRYYPEAVRDLLNVVTRRGTSLKPVPVQDPAYLDQCVALNAPNLDRLNTYLGFLTDNPYVLRAVIAYFGLDDGRRKTLAQVAARFDVSSERIQALVVKAQSLLSHSSRTQRPTVAP